MTRKGTAVDVIEYDKNSIHYRIPLRLLKLANNTFTYRAVNDDPEILVTNTDPNKVREEVIKLLEQAITIEWSTWILIESRRSRTEIDGPHGSSEDYDTTRHAPTLQGGRSLGMIATRWRLGKVRGADPVYELAPALQEDKHAIYRTDTRRCGGTPNGITYDKKAGTWSPQDEYALIPDTAENQHKVRSILNSLDILGKSLAILMGQDRITETLQNVKLLGLPSPDSAPGVRRRGKATATCEVCGQDAGSCQGHAGPAYGSR